MVPLDEPTAALGVAQTAQVLDLIRRLRERGLGVVVITHNLVDAFEVADGIFVLRLGRAAADNPARLRDRHGVRRQADPFPPARVRRQPEFSGGNELLLLAIAGPVIAGTSLFGGRGSVWTALLGALVIGSIANGMDLPALSSAV